MSWTNDVVLEFVELYRKEQILWDPKHESHRNRSEVTNAWLRIQSSLSINCSISDLKKKKESLMTSFRLHYNKKKKCGDVYHTTWFAYPALESFLGGKYECDSTNQMESEFFCSTPFCVQSTCLIERNSPAPKRSKVTNKAQIIEGNNDIDNKLFATRPPTENITIQESHSKLDVDEYDLYGQLLAKKLRKLDEHQRDIAMHEIDNIMFRVKMQSAPPQPCSFTTSSSPIPRKVKSPMFINVSKNYITFEDDNQYQENNMHPQSPS